MSAPSLCCNPCSSDPLIINVPGTQGTAGAAGADGTDGVNAYTTLTGDLTIPAVGANATVTVAENSWMGIGQTVFASDGADWGTFTVASKTGTTSVTLTFVDASNDSAVGAVIGTGGTLSPAGALTNGGEAAAGSPEGAITGSPGKTYLNTTDESLWVKKTGTNSNTGWVQLTTVIAMLFTTIFAFAAPPLVRQELTTNLQAAAINVVSNVALGISTTNLTVLNVISNVPTTNAVFRLSVTNAVRQTITNDYRFATNGNGLSVAYLAVIDAETGLTNKWFFTNGILYTTNRL